MVAPRHPHRYVTIAWLAYWCALFVVMHVPVEGGVRLPRMSGKVIHFGLYFALTLLGGYRYWTGPLPSRRGLIAWCGVYVVFAALDEWTQQFCRRDASVGDFAANVAGVMCATGVLLVAFRTRRLSDPSPGG